MMMLSRFFATTAFALIVATSTVGHAASTDIKTMPSGTYVMDPSHASLVFHIMHLGFSEYTGRFDSFESKIDLDSAAPQNSKVEASIIPNSIDTGNPKLEEELKIDKWFNVIKYPKMTFVSKKINVTGPTTGTITGDFTMLGVTQSVTLDATFIGGGDHPMKHAPTVGFHAVGSLKRSMFGLSNFIPMVGDDVTFEINAEFNKV